MKYYEIYLKKKAENKERIYLFKIGNFYNVFAEDALKLSKELDLKLSVYGNVTEKCGFPLKSLDKYLKFIKLLNLEYEIILNNKDSVLEEIKNLDLDIITAKDALIKIKRYKELLNE